MSLMVSAATSVTFHVYHCIHCWDLSRLGHESDVVVVVGRWGGGGGGQVDHMLEGVQVLGTERPP